MSRNKIYLQRVENTFPKSNTLIHIHTHTHACRQACTRVHTHTETFIRVLWDNIYIYIYPYPTFFACYWALWTVCVKLCPICIYGANELKTDFVLVLKTCPCQNCLIFFWGGGEGGGSHKNVASKRSGNGFIVYIYIYILGLYVAFPLINF